MTKVCNMCNIEKDDNTDNFRFDKRRNYSYARCRTCERLAAKADYASSQHIREMTKLRGKRRDSDKIRAGRRKRYYSNREKELERSKRRYHENKDRARAYQLRTRFNISPKDYDTMLELQNGVCAICKKSEPSGKRLAIDHCHNSGRIRKLLCTRCNTSLKRFEEVENWGALAASYIEEHKTS
jgi:hypothetical protein